MARLARPLARPNTWWNFWAPLVFTADGRRLVTVAPLELGVATLSWDLWTGESRRGAVRGGHGWTNPSSDLIGDLCAEVGDVAGRTLGPRLVGAPHGRFLIAGDSLGNGLGRNPPVVSRSLTDGATTELGTGRGVGLSPDGQYLAIGDRGNVRIVPAGGGDPIATLFDEGQNTPSHYALAFSPDGERLAVGDSSGRLRIVETTHWRMAIELVQHPDYVYSLAWSPDGERLVSSCGDGIVRLFDALHTIPRRLRAELRAERTEEQAVRLAELVDQLGDERRAVHELLDREAEAPDELRAARRAALLRWARSND